MTTKKYNINELLAEKKDLEKQVLEFGRVNPEELEYKKQVITDTRSGNDSIIEEKPQISLNDFAVKFNTALDRLAKVNIAIQKHNAEKVAELLQQRETARSKVSYLNTIKLSLPRGNSHRRSVTGQSKEGEILETTMTIKEPMFSVDDVEKQLNEASAQERKINTEIQKINLEAQVTIE